MNLVSAYLEPAAAGILYDLLAERPRENWVSHEQMPTLAQHRAFVESRPFLHWYLIRTEVEKDFVGAVEATSQNEIGVSILKRYQRRGLARAALRLFVEMHEPMPAIPAIRNGRWHAHVAPGNAASIAFFQSLGFRTIQHTMIAPLRRVPAHVISEDAAGMAGIL